MYCFDIFVVIGCCVDVCVVFCEWMLCWLFDNVNYLVWDELNEIFM